MNNFLKYTATLYFIHNFFVITEKFKLASRFIICRKFVTILKKIILGTATRMVHVFDSVFIYVLKMMHTHMNKTKKDVKLIKKNFIFLY